MSLARLARIVADALIEDIGEGDVTRTPIIAADTPLHGAYLCKAQGVVAGLGVVAEVFRQVGVGTSPILIARTIDLGGHWLGGSGGVHGEGLGVPVAAKGGKRV